MKRLFPNYRAALTLTPAIFLLSFWVLALSDSPLIASVGLWKLLVLALILSFGVAYSITIFFYEYRESSKS